MIELKKSRDTIGIPVTNNNRILMSILLDKVCVAYLIDFGEIFLAGWYVLDDGVLVHLLGKKARRQVVASDKLKQK